MLYKCLWSVNIACAGLLGSGSEVNNAELEELLKIAKLKADRVEKNKVKNVSEERFKQAKVQFFFTVYCSQQ